eukprot:4766565-Alexandrium_andersonii.AAC.1
MMHREHDVANKRLQGDRSPPHCWKRPLREKHLHVCGLQCEQDGHRCEQHAHVLDRYRHREPLGAVLRER